MNTSTKRLLLAPLVISCLLPLQWVHAKDSAKENTTSDEEKPH